MAFDSRLCLWIIVVTTAVTTFKQVYAEGNFAFAEPSALRSNNFALNQSVFETNGSKARISRSLRMKSVYNGPRRNPSIDSYSHLHQYNPLGETYNRHYANYQKPSYKAIDVPIGKREEPIFWPTPMQHHVEHNAKELPKMFYLKKTYQDRRPSPYDVDQESSGWRSRFKDQLGTQGSFYRNQDGTYRLPGPRPQSLLFRHLVTQTERPVNESPNVQVYYDYRDQQRPSRHQQIETDLSSAIANFVQERLSATSAGTSPYSRWTNEPFESDIEVYVRFIDRRRRKA